MTYKDFTAMPIWKKAFAILLKIHEVTKTFPTEEKYGLVSDMRRAANSVTNHIPDKYFREIRAYGLFSNRLRGKLLPQTRKALKQKKLLNPVFKSWRERTKNREAKDPLVCEICNIEMVLVFVCFTYQYAMTKKIGIKPDEIIPSRQIKIDTS